MKRLSILLLLVVGLEAACLVYQRLNPPTPEFPLADVTLLGDRISIETLANMPQQLDRRNPAHWKELGEFYLTFGYYPQAEQCLRVAHELAPDDHSLLLLRAICLDRLGAKREAIEHYRLAIESNVSLAEAYRIRIAHCLLAEGDDGAAIDELKQMPSRTDARLLLSRILIRSGRAGEARALLRGLQQEVSHGVEPYSMDCWAAEELGDWDAAYNAQSRAQRARASVAASPLMRPEDIQRRRGHSNLVFHHQSLQLEAAGRIEAAREACRQAIRALWEEDMVLSSALLEINLGNAPPAIEMLNDAIARVGESSRTLEALGDAWQLAGDAVKARDAWLSAAQMRSTAAVQDKLARSYDTAGDPALAKWHRGLADYARGTEAWLDNELSAARQFFRSATEQAADDAASWYYLAETERLTGGTDAARAAYERCLRINPNHGRAADALERLERSSPQGRTEPGA